ncbi:MAG: DUF927 domain-containing protein, partial [Clostridia bacterium]
MQTNALFLKAELSEIERQNLHNYQHRKMSEVLECISDKTDDDFAVKGIQDLIGGLDKDEIYDFDINDPLKVLCIKYCDRCDSCAKYANDELIDYERLTAQSILETDIFDILFSFKKSSDHDLCYFKLQDQAGKLKVKTRFDTRYKNEKREREQLKLQALKGVSNLTKFHSDKYQELICGTWQCGENGVRIENERGFSVACYNPIMPVKRLENLETGTEKMAIAFKRDGYWREHIIDRDILSSSSKITSGLSKFGAIVTSETARHLVKYLADIESYNSKILTKQLSTSKFGWGKAEGDEYFMPYTGDKIIFDSQDRFKTLYESISEKGSRTRYMGFLKKLRLSNRLEPKLALVTSLASVLVEMCGTLPFIVHLYGEGGKGKTLCLMLGASVWGDTNEGGYIADPKSTQTAFEMRLGVLNHLPFICDDMGSIKKKFSKNNKSNDFADFIYLVCNGRGNERSNVNLGLNYVPNWRNCSLTSSEKPITSDISQGGELLRTIEVETERGYIFSDSKAVADFLRTNYGFLGKIWVEVIKDLGKEKIMEIYKSFKNRIETQDTAKEKEGKQIESVTVLLTADKIFTDYIMKDDNYIDFDTMYNLIRSNNQMSDNERAFEWIKSEIDVNISKFKTTSNGDEPIQRWGYIEDGWTWINVNIFNDFCERGNFDKKMFVKWASERGKAQHDKSKLTKKKWTNGKTSNFISLNIKDEVLEDTDDE